MATIFSQPNPTGNANCVVLASQENYFAPFLSNIGTWTQLRVSAFLSYCGSGSFNSSATSETIPTSAPNLAWYWGIGNFTNSLGYLTPTSVGCNFAGVSTYGSNFGNTCLQDISAGTTITTVAGQIRMPVLVTSDGNYSSTEIGNNMVMNFQPFANTGSQNYCVASTMVFTIFNKGQTGQTISINLSYDITGATSNPNISSYTDIGLLRNASINLAGSGQQGNSSKTFIYTTGLSSTGGPLPIPDTMYMHSPFNNSFMRIHNILIEKFY